MKNPKINYNGHIIEKIGDEYQTEAYNIGRYYSLLVIKKLIDRESNKQIQTRLSYLRQEIQAERISYSEITELQSLAEYIPADDIELLQWAGVPEKIN